MIWWGRSDTIQYPGLAAAVAQGKWEPGGPLASIPFVVWDSETTGFHPFGGDEIIAIAAKRLDTGAEFNSLVNPGRPIPVQVTDLTGITQAAADLAPPIFPVMERFFEYAGRCVLVAHCVDFDRAFLEAKLRKAGRLRWTHPVLDTMVLANALFPTWRNYRLEHCATMLQTVVEERHTALGDSRTTASVLVELLTECTRRGLITWEQVSAFLHARNIW